MLQAWLKICKEFRFAGGEGQIAVLAINLLEMNLPSARVLLYMYNSTLLQSSGCLHICIAFETWAYQGFRRTTIAARSQIQI